MDDHGPNLLAQAWHSAKDARDQRNRKSQQWRGSGPLVRDSESRAEMLLSECRA